MSLPECDRMMDIETSGHPVFSSSFASLFSSDLLISETCPIEKNGSLVDGILQIAEYHLLVRFSDGSELFILYPLIAHLDRQLASSDPSSFTITLHTYHYLYMKIKMSMKDESLIFYEYLLQAASVSSIKQSFAFKHWQERQARSSSCKPESELNGWDLYDPFSEYGRMGVRLDSRHFPLESKLREAMTHSVGTEDAPKDSDQTCCSNTGPKAMHRRAAATAWRFTAVNCHYSVCPSYPSVLVVPEALSDSSLRHAAKFRSKGRFPVLSYLHSNGASLTRSSQPLVGLARKRSVQDEKLVEAIFMTSSREPEPSAARQDGNASSPSHFSVAGSPLLIVKTAAATRGLPVDSGKGRLKKLPNLILDARPTANALANIAAGAGSENMEYYKGCERHFLGIDNIHVMRDAQLRLTDSLPAIYSAMAPNLTVAGLEAESTDWMRHLQSILEATNWVVKSIHVDGVHVLVHCSDGWDRTAQLTSLASLCLDPYYRTWKGFAVLIEKEWRSFGHRFQDRSAFLSVPYAAAVDQGSLAVTRSALKSLKKASPKDYGPIFCQFLECVYQLMRLYPTQFQFNESLLLDLLEWSHSGQFGTFLFNSEAEAEEDHVSLSHADESESAVFSGGSGSGGEYGHDRVDSTHVQPSSDGEFLIISCPSNVRPQADRLKNRTVSVWTAVHEAWPSGHYENPYWIGPEDGGQQVLLPLLPGHTLKVWSALYLRWVKQRPCT